MLAKIRQNGFIKLTKLVGYIKKMIYLQLNSVTDTNEEVTGAEKKRDA